MAIIRIDQTEFDRYKRIILEEIAAEARRLAPVDQGQLHDSIQVVGDKIVVNAVDANGRSYAAAVEFGRAPGQTMPPGGPNSRLAIWAGTPGRAVWELAKAIAARGIRPKPFFFPAVKIIAERHFRNVKIR